MRARLAHAGALFALIALASALGSARAAPSNGLYRLEAASGACKGRVLGYASGNLSRCAPNAPRLQSAAAAHGSVWHLRDAPGASVVTLGAENRRRGCAAALTVAGGGANCAGLPALNRTGYERWAVTPAPGRPGAYFLETTNKGCAPRRLEPAPGCAAAALVPRRAGAPAAAWRIVRVLPTGAAPPPRSPPPRSPPPAPPAREVTSSFTVPGVAPGDFGAAQQAAFCAKLLASLGLTGGGASCAVTSVAPSGGAGRRRLAQSGGSDVTFKLTFEVGPNADAAAVAALEARVRQVLATFGDWTAATAAIDAAVQAAFPGLVVSVVVAGGPAPASPAALPVPEPSFPPVTTFTPGIDPTPVSAPVPYNPCAGVRCAPATACKNAGFCSGGACSAGANKPAGTVCTIASPGDGACAAGACVLSAPLPAPAGSWATACEGDRFGCGLDTTGVAWCWGTDASGALGQGPTSPLPLPAAVLGGLAFSNITCGNSHVCALNLAGAAYCWGYNGLGGCGVGNTTDLTSPAPVNTVVGSPSPGPRPAAYSKIAAGGYHTCAISADAALQPGSVWCWGANSDGQLGQPATALIPVPMQMPGPTFASDIAAGTAFSCAVVAGDVECWGKNDWGQLGNGTTDSSPHPAPLAVPGIPGAAANVTAGSNFACAWPAGGSGAWCWGNGANGRLGNGAASGPSGAVAVATPAGVAWAQLAAYSASTCGLSSAGATYCWGTYEIVGAGDFPAANTTVPVAVSVAAPAPQRYSALSTGSYALAALAVATDTTLWGWGFIGSYQLGNNVTTIDNEATDVAYTPTRAGVPYAA